MLQTLYNYFGFAGSLLLAFLLFLFFVFWMAGVAGICTQKKHSRQQMIFVTLAVFVPVYPVIWLIIDMITQKKELRQL